MKRLVFRGGIPLLFAAIAAGETPRALFDQYCVGCHNDKLKTGGLSLAAHVKPSAQEWEKVIRKLRAGMMPPAGMPRPDQATINALATSLENEIDQAAAPIRIRAGRRCIG